MGVTVIITCMSELFKSQSVTHTRQENTERRNRVFAFNLLLLNWRRGCFVTGCSWNDSQCSVLYDTHPNAYFNTTSTQITSWNVKGRDVRALTFSTTFMNSVWKISRSKSVESLCHAKDRVCAGKSGFKVKPRGSPRPVTLQRERRRHV